MEFDGERAIDLALKLGADYCDVRIERRRGVTLEMRDNEMDNIIPGDEEGIAVRVIVKGSWGFFSTNRPTPAEEMVKNAIKSALALNRAKPVTLAEVESTSARAIWTVRENPLDIAAEEKYALMKEVTSTLMAEKTTSSVRMTYADYRRSVHFLSSEGADIHTALTRIILQTHLTVKEGASLVGYRFRIGGTAGFEIFKERDPFERAERGISTAKSLLKARHPPSGRLPMVADPELAGVFIHEALGHASEGDHVVGGKSILEGLLGETIAAPGVNVFDDPGIDGAFGSYPYDHEGVIAQRKEIIRDGVLVGFITDRESAHELGIPPNGGARAADHSSRPIVRMSNTMIGPGDRSYDEIFEDIKLGILAKGSRGGQVDTTKGTFQFNAQEAYLIERGEITQPLRDVSLSGDILTTLKHIDAMTREIHLGEPGFCGKGGELQIIPVGDGGPYVRFREIVIGGRS